MTETRYSVNVLICNHAEAAQRLFKRLMVMRAQSALPDRGKFDNADEPLHI